MHAITQYLDFLAEFQEKQTTKLKQGPARFMLNHGREYPFGPDSFKGRRAKAKQCYANAGQRAMGNPDVTYVEGYVMTMIPIEHAWLVDNATGRVIDPTLKGEDVHGYFGVPIKTKFLIKTILRTKVWGVLSNWMDTAKIMATDPAEIIAN